MSLLRLLNVQGIAGLAVALALAALLVVQKAETRRWRHQSDQFERLYRDEQAALAETVSSYRAAAAQARASDLANLQRVTTEQRAISERSSNDYQARIAAARAAAERLRPATKASRDSGVRSPAPVPVLSPAPRGVAQAAGENGLPEADRLLATEQAIQLDELIAWVRRQAAVDNSTSDATPPTD